MIIKIRQKGLDIWHRGMNITIDCAFRHYRGTHYFLFLIYYFRFRDICLCDLICQIFNLKCLLLSGIYLLQKAHVKRSSGFIQEHRLSQRRDGPIFFLLWHHMVRRSASCIDYPTLGHHLFAICDGISNLVLWRELLGRQV